MISRVLSAELPRHIGERVTIAGWLHRRRELKSVTFLIIRDRSGLAQVVRARRPGRTGSPVSRGDRPAGRGPGRGQRPGSGRRRADRAGRHRAVRPGAPPPFDLYRPTLTATLPTILDHAPTTLRHPQLRAGFEIAAASAAGFRAAMDAAGFTEIFTPKIVESATEGGANVFRIDYFGRPAYLAQSPQFYKQAMVGVFERVYEVGPGLPGRAARHCPAPGPVRQPGRRAGFHYRPFRRDARTAATRSPGWSIQLRERGSRRPAVARRDAARRCRPRSRMCISPRRWN